MEEEILPSLLTSFSSSRACAPLLLRSAQLQRDFSSGSGVDVRAKRRFLGPLNAYAEYF